MGFFEPPPPPPEPEPEPAQPPWLGPPEHLLGTPVGMRALLVQREDLAVAVVSFVAFPTGVRFDVLVKRRRKQLDDEEPFDPFWRPYGPRRGRRGELPDDLFRFGAQLADGGRATSLGLPWHGVEEDEEPRGPLLVQRGGGGDGRSSSTGYWLWPLPPAGPLTFVCEWPAVGLAETRTELDAGPLRAAAEQAIELGPAAGGGRWHVRTSRTAIARSVRRRDEPGAEPPTS